VKDKMRFVRTSHDTIHLQRDDGSYPCGVRLTLTPTDVGTQITTRAGYGGWLQQPGNWYLCGKCARSREGQAAKRTLHSCPTCRCGFVWEVA
jgi:hypothetical protein